ncbi:CdaR family protein [uncultured Clostridium sp.]|uniref:CdaR family protein n=1 Tax=uncultured Clostridium sp. TaxID=59620 RepID=UPI00321760C0
MDKQKRQDIIIRICCVVAALVLWMYIRSSEDPVTTSVIKYVPVKILNEDTLADRDLVLIPNQDFYINLTVKAPASTIKDLRNKDFTLVADLQGYALTPGENKVQVKVKESSPGVSVVNSDGLLMDVDVDTLADKHVNVTSETVGEVAEGYYNDDPIISPNSVKISGPQRYLDQVVGAVAQVDITNASEDIDKSCKVTLVDSNEKEVTGLSIYPEYVQVKVHVKKGKYLGVKVQTTGTAAPGVTIVSMEAAPKSIEVAGASEVIDKITSINTAPIDISKITESTTIDSNLVIPEGIHSVNNEQTVKVKITVKKYSEKTLSIPINYTDLGEKLTLENSTPTLKLIITGEESELSKVSGDNFKATVDLKSLTEGSHEVKVQLSGVPNTVQVKSQTPESVTLTIKAKTEEKDNNAG